ncbi:MAG: 3-methyl-2-oxobutanoate dehydrogenase subunit VorB [Nitrospirae bacterium]|uniref:3-methyl-2-oxobutanoate dehydrogenase subunit VorB n=1 Tax=Candidatus Magnetobacterium casense TaxID=1455061 RepID=UPI00058D4E81|nr:3-methyl-2-oxobutanoate dehydrogenase subunit VorB [Candidatus Magnetobacterium casensis]MBF0338802.1 3-methyl-2-oxobutanoate dehydrogenase subunit VorB [Nitrospirota bacterium]
MTSKRTLMKGNEAIAEAAIHAGCRFYAGYPITPQNEIPEYLSRRMPEVGGVFIQAESEISAINMVYGAAAAGVRAMTSSSSPGISLKQEGISFLAGAELPSVIVNMQRGGPGLGNISGSQSDYFQSVKGGGHGDYRLLVYAPYNVQEMWDLTFLAFDRADLYRNPVLILADAILGQMMEPFYPTPYVKPDLPQKNWALTGCLNRPPNIIRTLYMEEGMLEEKNNILAGKYRQMRASEVRYEAIDVADAQIIVVAFGSAARIALSAIKVHRKEGLKVGLFRPITLYPFPEKELYGLAGDNVKFLTIELNTGQMVEDVRLAVNGKSEVLFYGRAGGAIIRPHDVYDVIKTTSL